MKLATTIASAAMAMITVAAFAQNDQENIRVVIDGKRMHFGNQQPTETGDRVMVPLRGIFEKLGAHVNWDPSTQTVSARKQGQDMKLVIGQLDASVNGQITHMDVPASLEDGVTMIPLRFVSEALGASVTWNEANREVDITTMVNLPRQEPPPPTVPIPPAPPVVVTPPPPPAVVVDRRPLRIVNNYREIPADTVLPFVLETRLSSKDSKPGDAFTATLDTSGQGQYLGLPDHTQVFGTVVFVRRQVHRDPGVIQLHFDHIMLPNGRSLPINGQLIGLDKTDVMRNDDGRMVAKNAERSYTNVFVAFDSDNGFVISLPTDRPLGAGMIHEELIAALDASQRSRLAHNAELRKGTPLGLRLYQSVIVPRD